MYQSVRKYDREFNVDLIQPQLSYRIADMIKSCRTKDDYLEFLRLDVDMVRKDGEIYQSWMSYFKRVNVPFITTKDKDGIHSLWKRRRA